MVKSSELCITDVMSLRQACAEVYENALDLECFRKSQDWSGLGRLFRVGKCYWIIKEGQERSVGERSLGERKYAQLTDG